MGKAINKNKDEKFSTGDLFRDTGRRTPDNEAIVSRLTGEEYTIPLRRLQRVERPWGFPDVLPFSKMETDLQSHLLRQLRIIATQRGIHVDHNMTEVNLRNTIRDWKTARCTKLILHQMKTSVSLRNARSTIALYKGERVYVVPGQQKDLLIVRDIEGTAYEIDPAHLDYEQTVCQDMIIAAGALNEHELSERARGAAAIQCLRESDEADTETAKGVDRGSRTREDLEEPPVTSNKKRKTDDDPADGGEQPAKKGK
jgi:hypothetical protein